MAEEGVETVSDAKMGDTVADSALVLDMLQKTEGGPPQR
jgi:hypothetical protein